MSAAIITLFRSICIDQHGEYLNILDGVLLSAAVCIAIGLRFICRNEEWPSAKDNTAQLIASSRLSIPGCPLSP